MKGRTKDHAQGSLENIVENLIKTWEMEAAHKSFKDWQTVDHDKFKLRANDAAAFDGKTVSEIGTYNVLLDGCNKELYDAVF